MLTYSFRVITLGLRLKKEPDVILASSPHLFAGLAGYILSKLKGAKFFFEVRDLWPQVFVDIGGYSNKSLVVKLLRVLEKFLYRRARKIIVVMPKASDYITRLDILDNKIVHIPQGVNLEFFSNYNVGLPEKLDRVVSSVKSKGKVLVGYTGAHGAADALDTIIEAARLLEKKGVDKVHFLLVGDGYEKRRLMNDAESLGLSNISFSESIPKHAMPALLAAIDIGVITKKKSDLYKYGVGFVKLFDYMVSARPVVWAVSSEDNPVAETLCGKMVSPENSEETAKAITDLCDLSDKERQDMGMRGYNYVVKHHSMPVLAPRLLKVLEN
jgi:glycosyltransferase involved in cell wall biosynthesis